MVAIETVPLTPEKVKKEQHLLPDFFFSDRLALSKLFWANTALIITNECQTWSLK